MIGYAMEKSKPSPAYGTWSRVALMFIIVGAAANLIFSLVRTDRATFSALQQIPLPYVVLAVSLGFVPWVTGALRLYIWTRFLSQSLTIRESLFITIGKELGHAVSPTAVGGGYVKAGMLIQKGMKAGTAATVMTVASVEDAIFFSISLPIAMVATKAYELPIFKEAASHLVVSARNGVRALLLVVLILSVSLIFLRRGPRVLSKVRAIGSEFFNAYRTIGKHGKTRLLMTVPLTAIHWVSRYTVISALLACFGLPVEPVKLFLFQWIVFTLATFVPTPGAAFGAEASFCLVYGAIIPSELLAMATCCWRFLTYYLQLAIGTLVFAQMQLKVVPLGRISRLCKAEVRRRQVLVNR
jgi:uncharacterized protein (TIRG00374 family)